MTIKEVLEMRSDIFKAWDNLLKEQKHLPALCVTLSPENSKEVGLLLGVNMSKEEAKLFLTAALAALESGKVKHDLSKPVR